MIRHNLILIVAGILLSNLVTSQQEPIFSKYEFINAYFNTSFAGGNGDTQGSLVVFRREQWRGFDGAPISQGLVGDVLFANNRVGLSLSLFNEEIGIDTRQEFTTGFSYRAPLSNSSVLAFGIRLSLSKYRSDFTQLSTMDPARTITNKTFFSPGFGISYIAKKFYLGAGVPALAVVGFNGIDQNIRRKHLYIHTGGVINIVKEDIQLRPAIQVNWEKAAPLQFTAEATLLFKKVFGLGIGLRRDDAIIFNVELLLNKKFRIVAAYDHTISDLKGYTDGTMEFMVGYYFGVK